MPIPLKLLSNGNLGRFVSGDSLLVDQIEKLSGTGNLVIGSLLGATQEVQLGSATGNTHVKGNLIVDGSFTFSNFDLLLAADPVNVSTTMSTTYTGTKLMQEQWFRVSGGALLKQIDYTYTGTKLTQEVRKVFASDGTTINAQLTIVYTYTGTRLTSATSTRNI